MLCSVSSGVMYLVQSNKSDADERGIYAMSVVIPDEILQASQLSPNEFRQEIALHLFQIGRLTLGYASQLANLQPNAFRQLLR